MLRCLHLADLHLGWEPFYLHEEKRNLRRRERDYLLEKAVDYALSPQHRIHLVLLVGDLFEHYRPDEKLVSQVKDQLHRLTRAGITVITVPGNHDEITYRDSVYRRHGDNWPGELISCPLPQLAVAREINGVTVNVYSLAYTGGLTPSSTLENLPREYTSGLHLGAFHGSLDWEGAVDRSLPLSSTSLRHAEYDYVALGHFHKYLEKKLASGIALYPGSVEFKSFHDPGMGHFTVVEFSNTQSKQLKIEKPPVEVRRHEIREWDLSPFADSEEFLAHAKKIADKEAMIKFCLTGTPGFPLDVETLGQELQEEFFYLEVANEAHFFDDSFLESITKEPTLRGAYVRRLHERQKKATGEREKRVLERALLKGLAALERSK